MLKIMVYAFLQNFCCFFRMHIYVHTYIHTYIHRERATCANIDVKVVYAVCDTFRNSSDTSYPGSYTKPKIRCKSGIPTWTPNVRKTLMAVWALFVEGFRWGRPKRQRLLESRGNRNVVDVRNARSDLDLLVVPR